MEAPGLSRIEAEAGPGSAEADALAAPAAAPVRLFDAAVPADRAEWLDLLQAWPDREVMAHPDYVRLFARSGDLVLAATLRTPAGGGILYPFILRPLAAEPWMPPGVGGFDITSAYGYGGPFAWNIDADGARGFWARMDRWFQDRGVVTSFARLALFPEQLLAFPGETNDAGANIVCPLERPAEEIWAGYAGKVRQNVRRAQARGCTLRVDYNGRQLDEFFAIYTSTMDRHTATSEYYFPKGFFEALIEGLKPQSLFFHVDLGGKIVASMLVLMSQSRAYYFLGGTLAEAFDARPSDFLMNEVILWCRAAGMKHFILGGGKRGSPGLLRYKQSFAPGGEKPFLLARKIHDAALAERLVQERRRWEQARGKDWTPDPGFFPAYRGDGAGSEEEPCPKS